MYSPIDLNDKAFGMGAAIVYCTPDCGYSFSVLKNDCFVKNNCQVTVIAVGHEYLVSIREIKNILPMRWRVEH